MSVELLVPVFFYLRILRECPGAQKNGLELRIFSTHAKEFGGLTWRQLNATITGLQEAMFKKDIFREAQFKILDGLTTNQEQGEGELVIWRKPSATA